MTHPRARAFDLLKAQLICKRKGHDPPTVDWYCPGPWCCSHDCRRCGAPVKPKVDWSGHP